MCMEISQSQFKNVRGRRSCVIGAFACICCPYNLTITTRDEPDNKYASDSSLPKNGFL